MFEMAIERGKIREFARAAQSRNGAYQTGNPVIPPTFLVTSTMVWEPPEESPAAEMGFELQRLLHGEEEYVFFGPLPRAGDTLEVSSRLGERWEREGERGGVMRFAQMIHEFRNPDGALVAEQRSTLIETAARERR